MRTAPGTEVTVSSISQVVTSTNANTTYKMETHELHSRQFTKAKSSLSSVLDLKSKCEGLRNGFSTTTLISFTKTSQSTWKKQNGADYRNFAKSRKSYFYSIVGCLNFAFNLFICCTSYTSILL